MDRIWHKNRVPAALTCRYLALYIFIIPGGGKWYKYISGNQKKISDLILDKVEGGNYNGAITNII